MHKIIKGLFGLSFNSSPLTQDISNRWNLLTLNANLLRFNRGLLASMSTDPNIKLYGLLVVQDRIAQNNLILFENPLQGDPNALYADDISRLNGSDINYGLAAINAGMQLGQTLLSKIPGKVGQTLGTALGLTGTVVDSIKNLKEIGSLSKSGVEGLGTAKAGNIAALAGVASDLIGGFMPEKSEYSGDKGNITLTMDSVYDSISSAAMSFGPVGMIVGGAMKAGSMLGKGLNALGGGTDAMTTTDAILGSSFLNLTPIGLINGFGGSRADTITKDTDTFEEIGASYAGTSSSVDDALTKSGKKYGLFSSGAKDEANREILEAKRLQSIMAGIASEARDRRALRNSMAAINENRRRFLLQGGYNQSAIRAARNGLSIKDIVRAKQIVKKYRLDQPSLFKEGGIFVNQLREIDINDISSEFKEYEIKEVTLENILPEFKEGGKVNVIPEGALHARLHHMEDADNLTKKGIPVVDNNGELQAEIEKNEIIYRLEVTKLLEELFKKYYSDEYTLTEKDEFAIEAGKLLVKETLYNTIDNTGLLNKIN